MKALAQYHFLVIVYVLNTAFFITGAEKTDNSIVYGRTIIGNQTIIGFGPYTEGKDIVKPLSREKIIKKISFTNDFTKIFLLLPTALVLNCRNSNEVKNPIKTMELTVPENFVDHIIVQTNKNDITHETDLTIAMDSEKLFFSYPSKRVPIRLAVKYTSQEKLAIAGTGTCKIRNLRQKSLNLIVSETVRVSLYAPILEENFAINTFKQAHVAIHNARCKIIDIECKHKSSANIKIQPIERDLAFCAIMRDESGLILSGSASHVSLQARNNAYINGKNCNCKDAALIKSFGTSRVSLGCQITFPCRSFDTSDSSKIRIFYPGEKNLQYATIKPAYRTKPQEQKK
jgi:hypothetical protein